MTSAKLALALLVSADFLVGSVNAACADLTKAPDCKRDPTCSWRGGGVCIDETGSPPPPEPTSPPPPEPTPPPPPPSPPTGECTNPSDCRDVDCCPGFVCESSGKGKNRVFACVVAPQTSSPTQAPTKAPTTSPTKAPTDVPTTSPTDVPTTSPTKTPTKTPTTTTTTTTAATTTTTTTTTTPPPPTTTTTAATTTTTTTAPPPAPSLFNIQLINMGPANAAIDAAFADAKARWEAIITNDLPGFSSGGAVGVTDWFGGTFSTAYSGAIDDVAIGYAVETIDGPGNILGSAGPMYIRWDPTYTFTSSAVSGIMKFDVDDFAAMSIEDMQVIVLHEMGHVLGLVGTLGNCGCDADAANVYAYRCAKATNEYNVLFPGTTLLLENEGGGGTACGHWEENAFLNSEDSSSELMTGWFEAWKDQPITRVTVAALEDIGDYEVDYTQADDWHPASSRELQGNSASNRKWPVHHTTHSFSLAGGRMLEPPMRTIPREPEDESDARKNLRG